MKAGNSPSWKGCLGTSHYLLTTFLPSLSPTHCPPTTPQAGRRGPQFPEARNRCTAFMEHQMGAGACPWLCRAAGGTVTPGADCEGRSLSLQSAPCPAVCAPQTLVLVLGPPGLEAGAGWGLSPQLLLSHHPAQPILKMSQTEYWQCQHSNPVT